MQRIDAGKPFVTPLEVGAMYVAGLSNGVSFASPPVKLTIQVVGGQEAIPGRSFVHSSIQEREQDVFSEITFLTS